MRRLVAIAALLGVGCTDPEACLDPEPGRAELGLGDQITGYAPMSEGDEVAVVLGPQGLHMIVVSVRLESLEPTRGDQPYRVTVAIERAGEVIGGAIDLIAPSVEEADRVEFLGLRAVFTIAEVRPLDGAEVELTATVTDGCGRLIEARRNVLLRL
jgi:hypothetical protein